MNTGEKKRILLSVTDKTHIEEFKRLTDLGNWEIITSGGTGKALKALNIPFIPVEEETGVPEMMDGRIKTLNHRIFGGILPIRVNKEHLAAAKKHKMRLIDIVAINFYNFNGEPDIENMDIGGPSQIRSAIKNGIATIPLVDPKDYGEVVTRVINNSVTEKFRENLVMKALKYCLDSDHDIYEWMRMEKAAGNPFLRSKKIRNYAE